MIHPLAGCLAKVARAKNQIAELALEVARHESESCEFVEQVNDDTGEHVLLVSECKDPPLVFSVMVGEIAHNLRSALDQLAYELVCLNTPRAPISRLPDFAPDSTSFPICVDESKYANLEARTTAGMPRKAQDAIRSVQPFLEAFSRVHPLWLLQALNNIDKHRQIPLCGLSPAIILTEFPDKPGLTIGTPVTPTRLVRGLRIGPIPAVDPNVPMKRTVACSVSFDRERTDFQDIHVVDSLRFLFDEVNRLVFESPAFLNFFPPL